MSLVRTLILLVPLSLAACGGAQKKPTAPADQCGAAGQNTSRMIMEAAASVVTAGQTIPATMGPDIAAAVERHCRADGWTAEAQACIASAADPQGVDACDSMMTQQQKDAVGQELATIAAKAFGGAAYGGAAYGGATYGN